MYRCSPCMDNVNGLVSAFVYTFRNEDLCNTPSSTKSFLICFTWDIVCMVPAFCDPNHILVNIKYSRYLPFLDDPIRLCPWQLLLVISLHTDGKDPAEETIGCGPLFVLSRLTAKITERWTLSVPWLAHAFRYFLSSHTIPYVICVSHVLFCCWRNAGDEQRPFWTYSGTVPFV